MAVSAESRNELVNEALSESSDAAKSQTDTLLREKIDYIPNASFAERNRESADLLDAITDPSSGKNRAPSDLPAHLRRMCEADLLTHEQESTLFREMNYLKFRADQLCSQLDADRLEPKLIAEIEEQLNKAAVIRDHLIRANMRLVISIVKKFVTPQMSFDEMLSDGIMILMQAVDKFDYDRGFRFSTYAYRSIARNAYRMITAAQKEEAQLVRDSEEWAFEQEDNRSSTTADQVWGKIRELTAAMLKKLDRREQFIIRSRYALGADRKASTFQSMADKLGVSKERVRQLEKRAVAKLQDMAGEYDSDELFSASMV